MFLANVDQPKGTEVEQVVQARYINQIYRLFFSIVTIYASVRHDSEKSKFESAILRYYTAECFQVLIFLAVTHFVWALPRPQFENIVANVVNTATNTFKKAFVLQSEDERDSTGAYRYG